MFDDTILKIQVKETIDRERDSFNFLHDRTQHDKMPGSIGFVSAAHFFTFYFARRLNRSLC